MTAPPQTPSATSRPPSTTVIGTHPRKVLRRFGNTTSHTHQACSSNSATEIQPTAQHAPAPAAAHSGTPSRSASSTSSPRSPAEPSRRRLPAHDLPAGLDRVPRPTIGGRAAPNVARPRPRSRLTGQLSTGTTRSTRPGSHLPHPRRTSRPATSDAPASRSRQKSDRRARSRSSPTARFEVECLWCRARCHRISSRTCDTPSTTRPPRIRHPAAAEEKPICPACTTGRPNGRPAHAHIPSWTNPDHPILRSSGDVCPEPVTRRSVGSAPHRRPDRTPHRDRRANASLGR